MQKSIKKWMPSKSQFWCIFDWFLERKMEACWYQDRIKNRCQLREGDFQKTDEKTNECLMIFQVLGFELGIKNRSKINRKLKPKMKCLLASMLGRFWWILRSKLGWKIEPRANQNGLENAFKKCSKKVRLEGVLGGWGDARGTSEGGILDPH